MQQLTLFDRLDNVTIKEKNQPGIEDGDLLFCEKIQNGFESCLNLLNAKIAKLESLLLTDPCKDFFEVRNNEIEYKSDSSENWGSNFLYSYYHSKVEVIKKREALIKEFKSVIFYYFINKYHLKIDGENYLEDETPIYKYSEVIDYLLSLFSASTIQDAAVQNIVKNFNASLRLEKIVITKNKISLPSYLYYDWFTNPPWISQYSVEKANILKAALHHFEAKDFDQENSTVSSLPCKYSEKVYFEGYKFPSNSFIKEVKLFKNGKVTIVFDSIKSVIEFKDYFFG